MLRSFQPIPRIAMLAILVYATSSCWGSEDTLLPLYVKASNTGVFDDFGRSMVWYETMLVVGAPGESSASAGIDADQDDDSAPKSGAVYVFEYPEWDEPDERRWLQTAYIKASNPGAGDRFGFSIALVGDLMAVGAYGEDSAATEVNGDQLNDDAPDSGAVYVFRHIDGEWEQEAYLKAPNARAGDGFGHSVAVGSDRIVVGAPFQDGTATGINGDPDACCSANRGAVYVFRDTGQEWVLEAYIKPSSAMGAQFGYRISMHYDQLAVSTPEGERVVYMFQRTDTTWEEQARIIGSGSRANGFGYGLHLARPDMLIIGNPFSGGGAVHVFRLTGLGWEEDVRLEPAHGGPYDRFGWSVLFDAGRLAVGSLREASSARGANGSQRDESALDAGAVYMYRRELSGWVAESFLKASNTQSGDLFGTSLAAWDGSLAIGAIGEDSATTGIEGGHDGLSNDAGAVYIYDELPY